MKDIRLNIQEKDYGPSQRLRHQEEELVGANLVPRPIEYADIDKAFFAFFNKELEIVDDEGRKVPTFTLFSNQRFSEYSQTWEHTDKDGNLLMNFKTINRDNNPQFGNIQGGNYNIPGNNRFTVLMREVKDKNGIDCYEITSMSQPIMVDLSYTISFVTSKYERLNEFNTKLNQMFASLQCYLKVNGHNMPMTLEDISDNSNYSVDDRKFFIQAATIKLMAYLIPKDDIKVELKPKRVKAELEGEEKITPTYVSVEYGEGNTFELDIEFMYGVNKVSFDADERMKLEFKESSNIITYKIFVNDDEYDEPEILLDEGDNIRIKINVRNPKMKSQLRFKGETPVEEE